MIGAVTSDQANGRLRLMNGWVVNWFTVRPWLTPPTRQMLFARMPITHGPGMASTTPVGPSAHCPVRVTLFVAVGLHRIGPMPNVILCGFRSAKYACSWMSAIPVRRMVSAIGTLTYGTMVRDTNSQVLSIGSGSTGWTLSNRLVIEPSPPPLLKLNCSGIEFRSATGFCDAFASSASFCWARTPRAVAKQMVQPAAARHRAFLIVATVCLLTAESAVPKRRPESGQRH